MAATFIVEDGTGLPNANSYLSLADANQYFDDHGNPTAWTTSTDDEKREALRLATQYLDVVYGSVWVDRRANDEQALDWPRAFVTDRDGFAVESDIIPQAIEDATAEAAVRNRAGTALLPDVDTPGGIKREKIKVGPLEEDITYTGSGQQIPQFTLIDLIVDEFTIGSIGHGVKEVRRG